MNINCHHRSVQVQYTEAQSSGQVHNSRVIIGERSSSGREHERFIAHGKLEGDQASFS